MEAPAVPADTLRKESALIDWLRARGSVLVGYSGGVDSSYLAVVAHETVGPGRALAVLGRSASVPGEQWREAERFARRHGIPLCVVETGEVGDPRYAANPVDRCYFCKSVLWSTLFPIARDAGLSVIVDGTNADDVGDHRPGARAALEANVRSPLLEVGLTKSEIRTLSRARGLETWDQPSSPCLASRLPYGTAVTTDRLAQVEQAERAIRRLGIEGDLRVRHHGDLARIEIDPAILDTWLTVERREQLAAAVGGAGFRRAALDLRGFRSGSLNVLEGVAAG